MTPRCTSLVPVACLALVLTNAAAQQTPSFEVASVKRSLADPGPFRSVTWLPGNQMRATSLTVRELVRAAYVHDGPTHGADRRRSRLGQH
jgi:hypothetical protein